MLKHLYLILVATFVFGFITGIIVFLQSNTGNEGDGSLITDTKGFSILAYTYGGCARGGGCPSYRIAQDGSYTYIQRSRDNGELKHEDSLSEKQHETLMVHVEDTNYTAILNSEFQGTCPITFDGVAYRYDIEYEGERYVIDSCKKDIEGAPLFEVLQSYFEVFSVMYRE